MGHEKTRIFYLDVIRAFAIITIIITHAMLDRVSEKSIAFSSLYIGSASLFFMTSGALIFPVTRPGVFLRRRLMSFVPQFIIWSLIYVLLAYWASGDAKAATHSLAWMLFSPTFSVGWFCYALIGLYLFAPIISPWLANAGKRAVELFLLAWFAAGLLPIVELYTYMRPECETMFAPFYGFMGYMVAGYYLKRWPLFSRPRRERIIIWSGLLLAGVILSGRFFFTLYKYDVHYSLTYDLSVNTMMVCMIWFSLCQYIRRAPALITRAVTVISVCSLEIYLCHMAWIKYVLDPLPLQPWLAVLLGVVLSVATGIALRMLWNAMIQAFRKRSAPV